MQAVERQSNSSLIVTSRHNLAELQLLGSKATTLLRQMVESAHVIRRHAALLVVCGVQMAEAKAADPDAWERFVKPLDIRVKGKASEYREIASVLFRDFSTELQGDGSLARRTISRFQVARYGAAIGVVHGWFRKGCTDLERLVDRIIKSGGVWTVAEMRKANVGLELDVEVPATLANRQTVQILVPEAPTLILVLPDGTYRTVPERLAAELLETMKYE